MEKFAELRQAVEGIARACGDLDTRYEEQEALELILAVGRHCPVTERVLIGAAQDQQQVRMEFHAACLRI